MLLGERKRILMTCLQHNLTYVYEDNKLIKCCVKSNIYTIGRLEKRGANVQPVNIIRCRQRKRLEINS